MFVQYRVNFILTSPEVVVLSEHPPRTVGLAQVFVRLAFGRRCCDVVRALQIVHDFVIARSVQGFNQAVDKRCFRTELRCETFPQRNVMVT
jgi:hypothetical protein